MSISIKEINRLAIPAILYNIVEPLIGLVDTAVIGNMGNEATTAQAGVGLAAGLISTLVWGLAQIRTAVSSLVSQYLGKGNIDGIKSLVPQSLFFSVLIGVAFWLLTALYFEPIANFLFLEKSDNVMGYADSYYSIRAMGLPVSLFIAGIFGVFRGYQNTSFTMWASFAGAGVNVILDLLLVNGYGWIPPMGVEGVAWASLISQVIMALVCVYFLVRKTPFTLTLRFPLNTEFKAMSFIALNMLLRTMALNTTFIMALRYASKYGENTLAAYSIGIQIWLFSSFFIDGYANAGNAIAGKLLGAKDNLTLKRLGKTLLRVNLIIAGLLSLTYLSVYPFIGYWFNDNLSVMHLFYSFFWMIILAQPLNSIAFTFDGIFKGLGEAKFLRNTLFIGTFALFIPILLLLDYWGLSIHSIWIAFIIWMVFRGGSLWWRFINTNYGFAD